jgi:hypothetical protein
MSGLRVSMETEARAPGCFRKIQILKSFVL